MDEPNQPPTLEEFLAWCDRECGFLVKDWGFERLAATLEYNPFSVRFRKGDLEVVVYGENHGQNASCDLVRGEDRLYLGFLVPAAERQRREPGRKRRGQLAQVGAIAVLLKTHASDFLRGDLTRFDSALAEWHRISRPRPISQAQRLERERQQALAAAGHAFARSEYAEVVRLLEPHAGALSRHQRRMLETARDRLGRRQG